MNLPLILIGLALLLAHMTVTAAHAEVDIPDNAYVRPTPDGQLQLNGQRVRYWGFIGGVAGNGAGVTAEDSPEQRERKVDQYRREVGVMVQRIEDLGFNLVRSWEGRYPNQRETLPMLYQHDYEPGDGSPADGIAYYFHKLDEHGIKLWMSSTNGVGYITADDVNAIDDPQSADAWRQAMHELAKIRGAERFWLRGNSGQIEGLVRMWDPRWEALFIKRLRLLADFPNHYKNGLRLGDDPQVVVWEISNEEFPFRALFGGRWTQLPAFFRNQLIEQWNDFLREKYKTQEQLTQAWRFLLPGESLAEGSILLLPLANPAHPSTAMNDTNPAMAETLAVLQNQYTRDDFNRRRGEDVVEFFTKVVIDHKKRVADAMRGMGKSCRLSSIVYDSGNDYRIQQAYMHQHADAVSTCSYTTGMAWDPNHQRFPFYSGLDASPRTSRKHPWFEQSTAVGKPHFVYETQINNKTKYRAEYPMRMAALAIINDWDIICWHSYSGKPANLLSDNPFDLKLATGGDHFTYRGDEVQLSAMKAASEIFLDQLVAPAPNPTTFIFGRRSLYDPQSMDYAMSYGPNGDRFIPTAYHYGAQVRIDPTREDDEIVGPSYDPAVFEPHPVKPNDQITFNWQHAYLKFDSPAVASYTGFFGQYPEPKVAFKHNSVRFSGIHFNNPDGIAYPVTEDEGYVVVSLTSTDGKPLSETGRALLSAVSTSFNTDYKLKLPDEIGPQTLRPFGGADMEKTGDKPVLVARVGLVVESPEIEGMKYVMRDFHLRPIAEGTVKEGRLEVSADLPVFVVELTR